jgi:hypothetical protein
MLSFLCILNLRLFESTFQRTFKILVIVISVEILFTTETSGLLTELRTKKEDVLYTMIRLPEFKWTDRAEFKLTLGNRQRYVHQSFVHCTTCCVW